MKIQLLFVLGIGFACMPFYACDSDSGDQETVSEPEINDTLARGFYFLTANCITCHDANPAAGVKVAPTLAEIKKYYMQDASTLPAFTTALSGFLARPDSAASKVPDAVTLYGRMSKIMLTEEAVQALAMYLYENPVETETWYTGQFPADKVLYADVAEHLGYVETGMSLAMQTKSVLGKNLLQAIKTKGTAGAVAFCSERAYPITDSMATALHAKIKRVSDRNRNPGNAANAQELEYINACRNLLASGQKLKPKIIERDGMVTGYYPILTDQMCLQCHGTPQTQVLPATLAAISNVYPADNATGFSAGELRGIWVVDMQKH